MQPVHTAYTEQCPAVTASNLQPLHLPLPTPLLVVQACKNEFDKSYGPFKVVAPGCQDCFQDCVTKLFTCKTCPCKCLPGDTNRTRGAHFPTEEACKSAGWCSCDDVEGIVVEEHQCDEVKYDSCDNAMKCKLKDDYYGAHNPRRYHVPQYVEEHEESPEYYGPGEEDRGEDGYFGDGGLHRGEKDSYYRPGYEAPEGHGPKYNRGPGY
jgi:hypothetical protein